jgi:hypothetical protein
VESKLKKKTKTMKVEGLSGKRKEPREGEQVRVIGGG